MRRRVPIPFNQVYRSMESGQVDGGENTISNIYSKKMYQVQKYLTISNHAYLGYGVLMNKVFWEKLSADQQKTINEAMQETTIWANQNAMSHQPQTMERAAEDWADERSPPNQ